MREAGIFGGKNALGIYGLSGQGDACSSASDCGANPPCASTKATCTEFWCQNGSCSAATVPNKKISGGKLPNAYGCFTSNDCQSGFCNTAVPVSGMKGQCQVKGQVNSTIGGGHGPGSYCNDQMACDDPLWCREGKCSGDVTDYACTHVETINYVLGSLGLPQTGAWSQAAQDQLAKIGLAFNGVATGCTGNFPSVPVPGKVNTNPPTTYVPPASKRIPQAPVEQASMFSNPIVLVALAAAVIGGAVLLKKKKQQKLASNRRRRARRSR